VILAAAILLAARDINIGLNVIQSGINSLSFNIRSGMGLSNAPPPQPEPGEFMSEWEAATFMRMNHFEFNGLLQSGELDGTYTTFQVARRVWQQPERREHFSTEDGEVGGVGISVYRPIEPFRMHDGRTIQVIPDGATYEFVTEDHKIFSREKLVDWLNNRIETAQ
jgi:hypothetical protein